MLIEKSHMVYGRHTYKTLGSALPTPTQYNKIPLTSQSKGDTLDIEESSIYFTTTKQGEKTNVNQYGTNEKEAGFTSR